MKSTGDGGARLALEVHRGLLEQAVALSEVARSAGRHDVLPDRVAAARARHDVVERQPGRPVAAVDAAPAVAGEERPSRDAPLDRARDAHVRHEADHVRAARRCSSRCATARRTAPRPPPFPSTRARGRDVSSTRSAARSSHSGRGRDSPACERSSGFRWHRRSAPERLVLRVRRPAETRCHAVRHVEEARHLRDVHDVLVAPARRRAGATTSASVISVGRSVSLTA